MNEMYKKSIFSRRNIFFVVVLMLVVVFFFAGRDEKTVLSEGVVRYDSRATVTRDDVTIPKNRTYVFSCDDSAVVVRERSQTCIICPTIETKRTFTLRTSASRSAEYPFFEQVRSSLLWGAFDPPLRADVVPLDGVSNSDEGVGTVLYMDEHVVPREVFDGVHSCLSQHVSGVRAVYPEFSHIVYGNHDPFSVAYICNTQEPGSKQMLEVLDTRFTSQEDDVFVWRHVMRGDTSVATQKLGILRRKQNTISIFSEADKTAFETCVNAEGATLGDQYTLVVDSRARFE
jgi:hypothetical protein